MSWSWLVSWFVMASLLVLERKDGAKRWGDLIFAIIMFHKWNMMTFGDFDGLALFIRIVQAGGFTSAERATGIPKATLSRRLSALEEALNVRLARRTKKGIILTRHGQQLFARSLAAFTLAEEAIAEVRGERAALRTQRRQFGLGVGARQLAGLGLAKQDQLLWRQMDRNSSL
jgi:hypothetical protein